MKYHRAIVISVLLCGLVTAGTQAQDSPWPMFRHDLKHTGRTDYTGPATPTVAWTFTANDGIVSSPAIGEDGTIYVGAGWGRFGTSFWRAHDSCFYALNPDGSLKWCYQGNDGFFSSPALGPDGTIYVGSLDGKCFALEDSVTYAKVRWQTSLEYVFCLSSPALGADGTVYIGSPSFRFYALDPVDGSIIWKYRSNWCIISSPAIGDDGTVYVGSKDHNLYAFDPVLGDKKWAARVGWFYDGHLVDASPAIGADGTIYFGTDQYGAEGQTPVSVDTNFWAANPDGSVKWGFPTDDGVESSPAIGPDGTIYFGSYDSCLYAVTDMGTEGVLQWKFRTNGPIDGSPSVDGDGVIYFGSRDSNVYALCSDGTVKWTFPTGDGIESSPTIDDKGYLYIGSFDGNLYALGTGAPDVGVVSVDVPSDVSAGTFQTPAATVRNFRRTAQSFDLACLIETGGEIVYGDTIAVNDLPGGSSQQQYFTPWEIGPDSGTIYRITVSCLLSADDNADNDERKIETKSAAGPVAVIEEADGGQIPADFGLAQNYPNPFNTATTIEFTLAKASFVTLKVYDILGTEMRTLVSEHLPAGQTTASWDGTSHNRRPVASGLYFCQLVTDTYSEVRKMTLLK